MNIKFNSYCYNFNYPEKPPNVYLIEQLLQSDTRLEKSVRLCDTREYLDTMTLASNLLEDGN